MCSQIVEKYTRIMASSEDLGGKTFNLTKKKLTMFILVNHSNDDE